MTNSTENTRHYPSLIKVQKLTDLADFFQSKKKGQVLLVADNHTYEAAGKAASQLLQSIGFSVRECILVRPDALVPDEKALAEIRTVCDRDFDYLLAVGSGSINDLMKHLGHEKGIPLITLATAASMDGYTSSVAVLTIDGYKSTLKSTPPMTVLSVTEILKNAPVTMTASGIGDLLGKYTSLADWMMSRFVIDEPYSEELVRKLRDAVGLATASSDGVNQDESVQHIMTALALSGEVMLEWGDSRPASGAEHHLSHFWETDAARFGRPGHLHGHKVGVATVLICGLYHQIFSMDKNDAKAMIAKRIPETPEHYMERIERAFGKLSTSVITALQGLYLDEFRRRERQKRIIDQWDEMQSWVMANVPEPRAVKEMLRKCGAPVEPMELDIDEALVVNALQNAKEMRSRYTVMRLAEDIGYRLA